MFSEGGYLPAPALSADLGERVRAVVVWGVDVDGMGSYSEVGSAAGLRAGAGGEAGEDGQGEDEADHAAVRVASSLADLACM